MSHNIVYVSITIQVFQYDGSQACVSLEFGFFALFGLFLATTFVIPTPFAVSYICVKRPKVEYSIHNIIDNDFHRFFCEVFLYEISMFEYQKVALHDYYPTVLVT